MADKYKFLRDFKVAKVNKDGDIENKTIPARDVLLIVGDIHLDATKYPAFSWEKELSAATDSDVCSNLEALMRHTLAIVNGVFVDPESKRPHYHHLLCRLEMLITSGLNHPFAWNSDTRDPLTTLSERIYLRVAPEFIYHLLHMDVEEVMKKSVRYAIIDPVDGQFDVRSSARILLSKLFACMSRKVIRQNEYSKIHADILHELGEDILAFGLTVRVYTECD